MTLERWVPRLLRDRLATAPLRRGDTEAEPESLEVAALWLDISGFTPLTRRFAEQGARGAELVSGILDRCYGALTERILAAGGDLVDFAGDGILAIWTAQAQGSHASAQGALADAVRAAESCARGIQSAMDRFPAAEGAELRFYAGIGAGRVSLLEVGGVEGRWRFLVAGEPLAQMGAAKAACDAGEVVLSKEAAGILRGMPLVGAPAVSAPRGRTVASAGEASPDALRAYLVDVVLRRLDAGQTAWLAEFRLASILFVVVPAFDVESDGGRRRVREAMRGAQERIFALDGSLNQVMADDTGLVLLAAWGVPDHTHEDDARRAVQAANEIRAVLAASGLDARVGVASGRVFCGAVGSEARCRYALVGAAVNRAARIAMASTTTARCDERTRELAERWLGFNEGESLALKGIDEPVRAFTSTGPKRASQARANVTAVSGRKREREAIESALDGATSDGPPLLLIEGEAGIGKSVLLRHLASETTALGRRLFVGAADAVERSTAYYPWREPVRGLFGIGSGADPAAERARVAETLRALPGSAERIPLLEPVLTIGLIDNPTTAAMAGVDRGLATREFLAEAFDLLAGPSPVLILDDLHWFDSASLELFLTLRDRVPRVLIAGATRPLDDDAAPQLRALVARRDVVRIPLVEMSGSEVLGMVGASLGVREIPAELAEFLVKRGEGHPLFTIELALLLREMGVLHVEGTTCRFDAADPRLAALTFSEKAEGIVATRIDRLDPSHQLALKVASVIGRAFEYQLVRGVYPIEEERPSLRVILDDLTRPKLIEEERPDPALAYLFRHVVIREVAYGLVSFAQRRQLHGEVARALEAHAGADLASNLPLLAHHWLMAEEPAPAISYLERAAVEALRRGAGREALRFLQDAFALAEKERARLPGMTAVRLAELERLTGEAMEQLLDVPESSRWLERAVVRLGHAVHQVGDRRRGRAVLKQAAIQLGHIIWPPRWRPRRGAAVTAEDELAARAFGTLAEHAYFESDVAGMLLFSLTSVNLAERSRSPVAAERSYVTLAHTAGLAGLTPLLNRYRRLSENTTLGRNMALRDIELGGRMLAKGRFAEAAAAGERAALLARRYADRHHEAQGWGTLASTLLRQGWPDRALEPAAKIHPTGRADWALAAECMAAVMSGRPVGALDRYAAMESWEPAFALAHKVLRAIAAEQRGDRAAMNAHIEESLTEMEGPGFKNAFTTGHYINLVALHARLYHGARAGDPEERERLAINLRRLERALRRHTRIVAISRPRLGQVRAMLAFHAGNRGAGAKHLAHALREAERLEMRAEQVAMLVEAARWGLPAAEAGLDRARAICRERGLDRLLLEVDGAISP